MNRSLILAGTIATLLISTALHAEDWTQWGGADPGRNMYSPAKGIPAKFEPGKFKPNSEEVDLGSTQNVKWVAKLGSQTYGNPVVANGRVYVGTNNASPRDTRFTDDRSILLALNEYDGSLLWQLVVPKLASGKVNDWEYLGLLSSPRVEGDKLWLVTSRCEVLCLDTNGQANGNQGYADESKYIPGPGKPLVEVTPKDADILWRYDMMDELGVFPHNASNCSVINLGNTLFACTSNGQDWTHVNIPSPLSPSFIALNKETGELIGEDDAKIGPNIKHGQWTSPSIGEVDGKPQVFFGGGDGILYALETTPTKDGESNFLKTAWSFDCVPDEYKTDKNGKPIKYPAAEGPSEINATPVFYKNRVYVAVGQDPEHGEGVGRLVCVDPKGKKGDITKTGLVWDYKAIHRSISTVSIDPENGLLFIADFSGFVHCLDADTGKVHWVHDMQAHMWGSTFVVDGKVFCGDEDGDFVCFASSKEKKVLSEVNMGAPIYSTPIIANGALYVATQTHLYVIAEGAKPVTPAK